MARLRSKEIQGDGEQDREREREREGKRKSLTQKDTRTEGWQ